MRLDVLRPKLPSASAWLPPMLAAVLLFALTEVPYAAGRDRAPPGTSFGGVISYLPDFHAYLSFVRQAAEGRWLFENRYAPAEHAPVLLNPQWLVVGWGMRWLGDPGVFVVWRAVGIALLVGGFGYLARLLPGRRERLLALGLFAFGGGLGWAFGTAEPAQLAGEHSRSAGPDFLSSDQSWGVQPFVQMLLNPHFAVVHGLTLIALALLIEAERGGRARTYFAAGLVALPACASRPYELIVFLIVVPVLQLVSGAPWDLRRAARRGLTLLALLPAFYPVWIVLHHPAFRSNEEPRVMPIVPLAGYLVLLGPLALVLCARLLSWKRFRLDGPRERVLLAWLATVLLLSMGNRIGGALPYSPQFLVTCMAPLVLLCVPVLFAAAGSAASSSARRLATALVLAAALPSTVLALVRRTREVQSSQVMRVTHAERAAFEWLAARVRPSDLVLAARRTGNRLPRHVSAHVFVGHWIWSPDCAAREAQAHAFFGGAMRPDEAEAFLRTWDVDWVWVGPLERSLGPVTRPDLAPGFRPCYDAQGFTIYGRAE